MKIEGLRSPQIKVGCLYHFGRMIDKIRLFYDDKLPNEYSSFRGLSTGLDGHLCGFLEINYDQLEERVKAGGTDKEILEWCYVDGHRPNKVQVRIWNGFVSKMGWRDLFLKFVNNIKKQAGIEDRDDIVTLFDLIGLDEGD